MAEMEKDLQSRLAEIEAKREGGETAEVASLKASIEELNEVISDRNKVSYTPTFYFTKFCGGRKE